MEDYFSNLCKNGTISDRKFWTTIKPFMSDKGCHENSNMYLLDNGTIVNDEMQVSAIRVIKVVMKTVICTFLTMAQ